MKLAIGLALGGVVFASSVAAQAAPQFIEANNVSLRYQLIGTSGPVVVLIHEMGISLESWDDVLPYIEPGHRILRYDLPGFGLSEKLRAPITMDDEVQDLAALLDGLGIQGKVTVVGSAAGGAIALAFAAAHPERTNAVIAFCPAAYPATNPRGMAMADSIAKAPLAKYVLGGTNIVYPADLRKDPARFARFESLEMATDPVSLSITYHMIEATAFAGILPKISVPAEIVGVSQFKAHSPAQLKALSQMIPGGRFEQIDSGHFSPYESPELVGPLLRRFLASVGG